MLEQEEDGEARDLHPTVPAAADRPAPRVRPDLVGVPLGFAAVGQCWSASRAVLPGIPTWSVDVWWLCSAAIAGVVTSGCVLDLRRNGGLGAEARDPTLGPFLALGPILLVVFGPTVGARSEVAGQAVLVVGLVVLGALGCYLNGCWILGDLRFEGWHPGYLLPTAIGGLVAAGSCALLGHTTLAVLSFGWGVTSWVAVGSIVVARLVLAAPLPPPLMPTLAILAAPPGAAADAWLLLDGDPGGLVVRGLAGVVVAAVAVQVCLVPVFLRVPFGAGWWALVVSYSAVATFALDWLARSSAPPSLQIAGASAVLVAVSGGIVTLSVRSAVAVLPVAVAVVVGRSDRRVA